MSVLFTVTSFVAVIYFDKTYMYVFLHPYQNNSNVSAMKQCL